MNSPFPTRMASSRRGFALIVTLSLMILLTVIAVGLLSLSAISLRTSSQGQAVAEARANARLALMLAIGELQREMGPDSRISAPNDAGTTATDGQRHWTAVYDAWKQNDDPTAPETPNSRPPSPKVRSWLASGANKATGGPAGTGEVLLVGPGSMVTTGDEVRVPMHVVSTGKQPGRVAWWTADEAVKAKVNAGPDASATLPAGLANSFFDAQAPPNVGQRAFSKLEQFNWTDGQRAKTISTTQVNLAAGLLGQAGVGNLSHDLTVHSAGVLADVRAGRLKRDLSNLLARPIAELRDRPLYLSDGRMNRFDITEDGTNVTNQSFVKSWQSSAGKRDEWGINLEELHLFHNLHRELTWNGNVPSLTFKNSKRETVINDPFYVYKRPTIEAVQFILSLKAVPDGSSGSPATPSYKMQMMLDAMVAVANPNDVAIEYPQGLPLVVQLFAIPYNVKWNITKDAGGTLTTSSDSGKDLDICRGYVGGGATNSAQAGGIKLEPGEVGAFGSSTASGYVLDLKRGFQPSGGVTMTGWDLKATGLKAADKVDFEMIKETAPNPDNNQYTYYAVWLGRRDAGGSAKGWQIDAASLSGGGDISSGLMAQLLQSPITPPEVLTVKDFIDDPRPKPVLMFSFLQNVEQPSGAIPPDGFASRPFLLNDPALAGHGASPNSVATSRHATQMLVTAETMNYQFRTLAAGAGGRNVYSGGGRELQLGGSFNVIKRRIPVAPPLSLGAFENAIASGFCGHFYEGAAPAITQDPYPTSPQQAAALTGHKFGWPLTAKAIGNSFATPFLAPGQVSQPSGKSVTDHSWMANTALWDSWFLSSIVDGTGATGSSPWMKDARSPRAQFKDLAEGKGLLRNKRFSFYPHKSPADALTELFSGENFKPSAINDVAKYLLVDGAFNVNSTSANAWAALLSSVRDQELLTTNGGKQKFDHPFGTLGFAVNTATSDTAGDWAGLRSLTATEIKTLATAIAAEVKSRGPFLSLADFVNRRPDSSSVHAQQTLGALQAAIDKSGLNDRFTGDGRNSASADFEPLAGRSGIDKEPKPARAVGAAGHLRQGHLLTALGSQITVRSDTFTIRAYGDARDATGTKIIAKAWCEAVIQRVSDYVDPTDAPEAQDGWPQASNKLAPANARFGRRLAIQSFRWLSSNEI